MAQKAAAMCDADWMVNNKEDEPSSSIGYRSSRKDVTFYNNCYLITTMTNLKRKIITQARTLQKLEHNLIGIKCNLTLTKSEEELFSRSAETNSTVCCTLIRELRYQIQDLNKLLNCWTEFDNMLEEFISTELNIQNKLSDLDSIVCRMTRKTKDFEESEVAEENCVHQERKQFLQRSEERRTILKDLVNSYSKSGDRDHSIRENRRMREKTLDKERLMDRAALKLALKRMMRIMGAPEITEIQNTSGLTKKEKSPSRINMTRVQVLSAFAPQIENSLKRHATFSRNCRATELSKRKEEDSNLKVEKILQPYNGCECNLRFSTHDLHDSSTRQVEVPHDVNWKKFSWWKRTKNKIRGNRIAPCGRKTAGDICEGGIFK